MDILTHTLSGVAVATCVASFGGQKTKTILWGALGGAFPDIDAISMWSRFDQTIGHLFALPHTGRFIYGAKFWYSHHAFFHSLMASFLVGVFVFSLVFLFRKISKPKEKGLLPFCKTHILFFLAFVLGYWIHLAGDLPTPASAWGGINLLFPSASYVGGSGKIWWWNNYDIFLLVLLFIAVNLILPLVSKRIQSIQKLFTFLVFGFCFSLILVQINTRQYNYAYTNSSERYAEMEQNSKKEEERILGKRVYACMDRFDRMLKIHF